MLHNEAVSIIVLSEANIEIETQPDRISLWLPVDRPIVTGLGGLLSAAGLGLVALGVTIAALKAPALGLSLSSEVMFSAIFCGGMLVISLIGLALRDVVVRLGERLIDMVHPLRARRERLEITQHVVRTARGPIDLSTIESLQLNKARLGSSLIAHTACGAVEVTRHRSAKVMEGLRLVLLDKARQRRKALVAQGIDPDVPESIPAALGQLRAVRGGERH